MNGVVGVKGKCASARCVCRSARAPVCERVAFSGVSHTFSGAAGAPPSCYSLHTRPRDAETSTLPGASLSTESTQPVCRELGSPGARWFNGYL